MAVPFSPGRACLPAATSSCVLELEKLLTRAVELNARNAWAFAFLGDVRSVLGSADALDAGARAIELEPSEPSHRLTAATILWQAGRHADALKAVQAALTLSSQDDDRRRARELQEAIERDQRGQPPLRPEARK